MSPTLISSRLPGLVILIVLIVIVAAGCSLPTAASPSDALTPVQRTAEAASVALSNLNGTSLGPVSALCAAADSPMVIDRLSFDYQVSGADLMEALLVKCDTGECMSGVPLGNVTACPKAPGPCDADMRDALEQGLAPACLTGDPTRSGRVDVLAMSPRDADTYLVMAFFEENGKRSNTVSTTVGRQAP
jgi:hypothetical protein